MPSERVDFKHVREHASFEPVIAHYGLDLQGKGDQRSALCCFHEENTGSLKINLGKKIFNCFGCGAKGNILDFVTLKEGGDPENSSDLRRGALKLAELCGIESSPRGRKQEKPPQTRQDGQKDPTPKEPAPAPVQSASGAPSPSQGVVENKPLSFRLQLDANHPYVATRGLKRETLEAFGIGYCGRGLMKGRIAIPIHNEKGELVAYAGRWADKQVPADTPRYLLPEGFGKQSVLFNLHRAVARDHDVMVIAESYWSVMKLDELGFTAVSPMGHSISAQHCALLKSFHVRKVVVLFDGDEAGKQGIAESVPLLSRSFAVYAPLVADGFKPHGLADAQLVELIEQARQRIG